MKRQKIEQMLYRILPPGTSLESFFSIYTLSLIVSVLNSMIFFVNYASARSQLYTISGGEKILLEGVMMETFAELTDGRFAGFILMAVVMLYLIIQNYVSFYQGSRSIYLMRRLPDRWDLLRRTAVLPVCTFLLAVVLLSILWSMYLALYVLLTPAQCLPTAQSFDFWQSVF